jgi:hypothetical protein
VKKILNIMVHYASALFPRHGIPGRMLKNFYLKTGLKSYIFKLNHLYFKKSADQMLVAVVDALSEARVSFWLDYGTLLGYFREKDFIGHDLDLDFGLFAKEYSPTVDEAMKKFGWVKLYEYLIDDGNYAREQTWCFQGNKDLRVDLFFYFEDEHDIWTYSFSETSESRKLNLYQVAKFTFKRINLIETFFKGKKVFIPKNTVFYLEQVYGENFMTPDINWHWTMSPNMVIKQNIWAKRLSYLEVK